jgi:hypothetical protein
VQHHVAQVAEAVVALREANAHRLQLLQTMCTLTAAQEPGDLGGDRVERLLDLLA